MSSFVVNHDLCRQDGICALVCPVHIIDAEAGQYPSMSPHKAAFCIGCGQCMAFCPTRACTAPGLDAGDCRPLRRDALPTPEQIEELVFSRRSIRTFKDKSVPRDLLLRLLDATRFAPTAKNTQSLRWIVFESREQTVALARLVIEWMRALPEQDPAMAAAAHAEGLARAWDRGCDVITRGAPQIVLTAAPQGYWSAMDAAIALAYLELLAQAHGVGCCWGGYICLALAHPTGGALRALVGIEEGEQAFGAQMLGFPRFRAVSRPPRKQLDLTWK